MTALADEDAPIELRRLWRVAVASRLGRPAELDVTRVVQTAVELADRDGLSGVTLPKVAKAVGFTPCRSTATWVPRMNYSSLCATTRSASRLRYPPKPAGGRGRGPISGPPAGPNQIAWMETALRVLRDTGLDWPDKVGIMMLLSGYVRHTALLAQELGVAGTAAAWTRPRPRSATAGAC